MKKATIIVLILVLLIGGFLVYKNQKSVKPADVLSCENLSLEDVQNKAQIIESKITSYKTETKEVMDKSTEGGEQTDYLSNGSRVLTKQIFFGETGKSEVSYYLSNDKVFYIKKVNFEYVIPLSEDPSGKIKNMDNKEFILNSNQKLCSWYKDQKIQQNDQDTKDLLDYLVAGI